MWGSVCTSIGLSSSGLSNNKWDSVSPSAHKHKNYCQTALWLSLSIALSSCRRLINSSPYRLCGVCFLSFHNVTEKRFQTKRALLMRTLWRHRLWCVLHLCFASLFWFQLIIPHTAVGAGLCVVMVRSHCQIPRGNSAGACC